MSNETENLINVLSFVVVILFFIIIVLAIIWIVIMIKNKKKENEKETVGEKEANIESNNKKKDKKSKENAKAKPEYNLNSIFDFMDFERIEDNMIIQKKGKYLMVIECQGINYDLMSEMERTSVEQGFIEFLNTLKYEIQIYVQTRTVNLESSLQSYKLKFRDIEDRYNAVENSYEQMREEGTHSEQELRKAYMEVIKQRNKYEYTKDIIADTEKNSKNSNVLHKRYYIILSYYEDEVDTENYSKSEIQNLVFSELYTRARSMMATLGRCEVNSKILDSQGLIELLYNAYNREDADVFNAKQALASGFEDLYSTAPDVFDKKIKLLDEEIQKKAVTIANEAVNEARSDKEMMVRLREENAKNMIFDFAENLITENESYLGKDIAEDAKVKLRRKKKETEEGGKDNESNEPKVKKARGRKPISK